MRARASEVEIFRPLLGLYEFWRWNFFFVGSKDAEKNVCSVFDVKRWPNEDVFLRGIGLWHALLALGRLGFVKNFRENLIDGPSKNIHYYIKGFFPRSVLLTKKW